MTHTDRNPVKQPTPIGAAHDASPALAALLALAFVAVLAVVALAGYLTFKQMARLGWSVGATPPAVQGSACIAPSKAGETLLITISLDGTRLVARCSPTINTERAGQ